MQGKTNRKHQANQIRKQKKEEVLTKKRNRGSQSSAPTFVAVVPLCAGLDLSFTKLLQTCDDTSVCRETEQGVCHISVPRFKQRLALYTLPYGDTYTLLDVAKVADIILFVLCPEMGIDSEGERTLTCLCAQGLPAVTFVTQGFKTIPVKKQADVRKHLQKKIESRFPGEKFHSVDNSQDALVLLRQLTNQKLRDITYRECRPHMISEEISFEMEALQDETGTLKVSGFVRGASLSVNSLVHLPGYGDFQMSQIDAPTDPYPVLARGQKMRPSGDRKDMDVSSRAADSLEEDVRVLDTADPNKQETLQSEVIPDPMSGEQTWPTEEELAAADDLVKKTVKRVPKGTSEYQAAWILNSDNEGDEDDESDDQDDDIPMEDEDDSGDEDGDKSGEEDYDTLSLTDGDDASKYDAAIDPDKEQKMMEKLKEERTHQAFPDEIDTPQDMPAHQRFARYRGLKSFRTSVWDPKENLPQDYARIFQFGNFRHTKKRVFEQVNEEGAMPGWYITVHIKDVPKEFFDSHINTPVVMFGLLPHEQKMSVANFLIHRVPDDTSTVKSKERLVFHVGYRRFAACPLFSQHSNGTKHKFERFLPQDGPAVATVYAPVFFPPAPVLMFKENSHGAELVAVGSLLSINPDRIIAKRIVLSGHPFKINKRSAVVRYMFFNRDDVLWFKPIELRTKWGRRGHIKEPLGTHGHMKCTFDGQLKSQDTILMMLYKRMFPRWRYDARVTSSAQQISSQSMETEDDDEALFS